MERDFRELKLTKEEIRLIGLAIANQIIDNNKKIEENILGDNLVIVENNKAYKKILSIIEYLER